MSFASPLWLLLLGLLPVIVILHAMAVRWRGTPVSSLVFWNAVMRERRASLRIRRLLSSLSLILELLAVAALAVALAGPRVTRSSLAAEGDVILVLDATASMQAREAGRTRFDLARARGLELVAGMRGGQRMAVIVAARAPRLAAAFTDDRAALRRALQAAAPTDEPGDMADSMSLALSLREARRGDQVVLLTDGAFDEIAGVDASLPWLHVIRVGTAGDNVGITGMAFRRTAGGDAEYELFLAVRSRADRAVSIPLTVSVEGTSVVARTLDLAPGERATLSIPWTGPTAGRVEARLRTGDALPVDDAAYAVFSPARRVQVLVVGLDTWFVQKALEALPGVTVRLAPVAPLVDDVVDDAVVYVDTEPPALEEGNVILFSSVPPNLPLRAAGILELPPVTGWDRSSPLLDSVPLGSVTIGQALALESGAGFEILASSQGAPLVLSWDRSGLKALVVAFDPRNTDLPLRPGFPVLLANALSWFFPSWLAVQADQSQAGSPRSLPTHGAAAVSVVRPDGSRISLDATGPSVDLYDTDKVGFYTVEAGGSSSRLAVSLGSEAETEIAPRFTAGQASDAAGTAAGPAGMPTSVWWAFAAAALVLLALEWAAWLRTAAGAAVTGRGGGRP
jgi:Ca-activated chloride channel homolog